MAPRVAPENDKLTTIFSSLPAQSTHFSLEFFPPKTQAGFTNLQSRLTRMTTALRPLFVTVTWGAGGSTATKSLELAEICQRQLEIPTVLHLTCTNSNQQVVDDALEAAKEVGVRNILALRGDPPRDEYKDEDDDTGRENREGKQNGPDEEFVWAVDLVRYIRQKHGDYFCVGVAGYPEGHADESNPEAGKQNVDHDMPFLAEKVRAGAEFIMTQLTYDVDAYHRYEEKLRTYIDKDGNEDIFKGVPIIPGLMPIQSYQITKRITKLSHAKLPAEIAKRIEDVKSDDSLVKKAGIDILSEVVQAIRKTPTQSNLPRILHFYTLNLEKSVAFVLQRCGLISPPDEPSLRDDAENDSVAVDDGSQDVESVRAKKTRRASSMNAQTHNRVIIDRSGLAQPKMSVSEPSRSGSNASTQHETETEGSGVPASPPTRDQNLRISEGQGALGREATWDDFPNGRWGPSHSPAFGEIDGYGPSLKVGPITARRLWGHPKKREDVTNLFKQHVLGQLDTVPWSDDIDAEGTSGGAGALRAETDVIRQELLRMIEGKGYWTLASQPAVDGVRSDDPVFGWGPKGEGFVFQKAFVEFFCTRNDWQKLKQRLQEASTFRYSWLKIDAEGQFETSESGEQTDGKPSSKRTPGTSGVNAVTWGVFKGKEITTPTIIEAESFRAWGEEAYSIWSQWRRCFPKGSVEERCVDQLRRDVVLVNVVGQDFRGGHQGAGKGLWTMLLDDQDGVPKVNGH